MQRSDQSKQETDKNLQTQSDYRPSGLNVTFYSSKEKKEAQLQQKRNNFLSRMSEIRTPKKHKKGFKFSQNKRFETSQSYSSQFCNLQIPNTNPRLSCSFGYGKRQPISKNFLRKSQLIPSPQHYLVKSTPSSRGSSFTCNRDSQIRRYLPYRQDNYSSHFTLDNPGNIYDIRQKIKAKPITIHKKLKMYTQKMSQSQSYNPGPKYKIDWSKLDTVGGLDKGVTFKTGLKVNLSKPLNENPGPQYAIPGFCDKFKKLQPNDVPTNSRKSKKFKLTRRSLNFTY